jgi:hypothetical protein
LKAESEKKLKGKSSKQDRGSGGRERKGKIERIRHKYGGQAGETGMDESL